MTPPPAGHDDRCSWRGLARIGAALPTWAMVVFGLLTGAHLAWWWLGPGDTLAGLAGEWAAVGAAGLAGAVGLVSLRWAAARADRHLSRALAAGLCPFCGYSPPAGKAGAPCPECGRVAEAHRPGAAWGALLRVGAWAMAIVMPLWVGYALAGSVRGYRGVGVSVWVRDALVLEAPEGGQRRVALCLARYDVGAVTWFGPRNEAEIEPDVFTRLVLLETPVDDWLSGRGHPGMVAIHEHGVLDVVAPQGGWTGELAWRLGLDEPGVATPGAVGAAYAAAAARLKLDAVALRDRTASLVRGWRSVNFAPSGRVRYWELARPERRWLRGVAWAPVGGTLITLTVVGWARARRRPEGAGSTS